MLGLETNNLERIFTKQCFKDSYFLAYAQYATITRHIKCQIPPFILDLLSFSSQFSIQRNLYKIIRVVWFSKSIFHHLKESLECQYNCSCSAGFICVYSDIRNCMKYFKKVFQKLFFLNKEYFFCIFISSRSLIHITATPNDCQILRKPFKIQKKPVLTFFAWFPF